MEKMPFLQIWVGLLRQTFNADNQMTSYLTKLIRAIHFMVLAFLMTLSSPQAAQDLQLSKRGTTQDLQKGFAAYITGDLLQSRPARFKQVLSDSAS